MPSRGKKRGAGSIPADSIRGGGGGRGGSRGRGKRGVGGGRGSEGPNTPLSAPRPHTPRGGGSRGVGRGVVKPLEPSNAHIGVGRGRGRGGGGFGRGNNRGGARPKIPRICPDIAAGHDCRFGPKCKFLFHSANKPTAVINGKPQHKSERSGLSVSESFSLGGVPIAIKTERTTPFDWMIAHPLDRSNEYDADNNLAECVIVRLSQTGLSDDKLIQMLSRSSTVSVGDSKSGVESGGGGGWFPMFFEEWCRQYLKKSLHGTHTSVNDEADVEGDENDEEEDDDGEGDEDESGGGDGRAAVSSTAVTVSAVTAQLTAVIETAITTSTVVPVGSASPLSIPTPELKSAVASTSNHHSSRRRVVSVVLELMENDLTDRSIIALTRYLMDPLTSSLMEVIGIKLWKNQISNAGAIAIGEWLLHSIQPSSQSASAPSKVPAAAPAPSVARIREIHLSHNFVSDKGAMSLIDAARTVYSVYITHAAAISVALPPPLWLRLEWNECNPKLLRTAQAQSQPPASSSAVLPSNLVICSGSKTQSTD